MPITRIGSTHPHQADGSSITATKPVGTRLYDFLIAVFTDEDDTNVHSGPAGWTQLGSTTNLGLHQVSVWYLVAGPAEPATYVFTHDSSGADVDLSLDLMVYRGVDNTDPINDSSSVDNAATTNPSTSVTTTDVGCMLVAGVSFDVASGKPPTTEAYSSDDGMTELHDDLGVGDMLHAAYDEAVTTATTYTRSFTYNDVETDHDLWLVALTPGRYIHSYLTSIRKTLGFDERRLASQGLASGAKL